MNPLLLVGGGGHCSSCVDVIAAQGEYYPAGIIDKKATKKINDQGIPFVGTDKDLFSLLPEFNSALITIGQIKTPNIRKNLFEELKNNGMNFPVILSPSALISKYAKINDGTIVMHGCILNSGVSIGYNSIINTRALLEHDVKIGNHCHVATGALVNGGVTICDGSFIGSGAIIHQGIKVGKKAIIAAGAVVRNDVLNGELVRDGN